MKNTELSLTPYLHFEGNCEQALEFYAKVFEGKIDGIQRFGEGPMDVPPSHKNQVLHAQFVFGKNVIMASDTFPGSQLTRGDNYAFSIGLSKDEETAKRIFNQLAEGGKVIMPFEKQFWGAHFGQVEDRFGIRWMVNCEM